MANGGSQQVNRQFDFGAELLVQRLKLWVLKQDRVNFLVQSRAFFLGPGNLAVGKVLVHKFFPPRDFVITPVQAQVDRGPYWATDVMAGDGIMRERIGIVTVVVMAVNVLEETPDMLAQGIVQHQRRLVFREPHGLRLLEKIT